MKFVRTIDWDQARGVADHLQQVLYYGEGCTILATRLAAGTAGRVDHLDTGDLIYVVTEGSLVVELDGEPHLVQRHGSAFVPAGVRHSTHNPGSEAAEHLTVIAPGIAPEGFGETPQERTGDGPAAFVRHDPRQHQVGGMTLGWLANRRDGATNASVYLAQLAPDGSGPPLHIHDFDQFYFVLEGSLRVDVALESHEVRAGSLAILPAGVPHAQRNAGTGAAERHIAVLAPQPDHASTPEQPWDVAVSFAPTGVHVG